MMKDTLKRSAGAILSALLALPLGDAPVWAAAAAAAAPSDSQQATLDAVDVSPDSVRVRLSADSKYTSFTTATPPRLIVQFENVKWQSDKKKQAGQGKLLKDVRGGQYKQDPLEARVVLDLAEMTSYKITKDGTDVVVALGGEPAAAAEAAPAEAPKPARPVAKLPAPAKKMEAPENPMAKVGEAGGMTTKASSELGDMAEKDTAVAGEAAKEAAPAALPPPAPSRGPKPDIMSRLPRDLVTLDFDNTDIKDVLRLLAAKARINIIYSSDVGGNVTLHLADVPFTDAFRTVLTMMNLATAQVGDNILRVMTPSALKSSQTVSANVTKVFVLNYAKASEIVPTLTQIRTAEGRTGTAIADAKTNSLIVTESPEGLITTERLVAQLDVRPKQVLIEAKLVEVGLNNSLNYGIQWDYTSAEQGRIGGKQGTNYIGSTAGPISGATALNTPLDVTANSISPIINGGQGNGGAGRGTGVQLPASTAFGAFTFGRITNNYFLNATLTAAAAQGKVKVLSDPKVATLNNQAANINVTTQIPYVTSNVASTGVQTQSVNYVTTGIQLSVTPSINADGRITLDINPNVSQPSATASASTLTGAPAVDSRNAHTVVLVRDGETIVIGGLINDSVSNQIAKIPLLGDIPILGWLFKKKTVTRTRSELLIFVTTKIMGE